MMDKKDLRQRILGIIGIVMLVLFLVVKFFAIPIGITISSIIGLVYSIKYNDKTFLKWFVVAFIVGILSVIYTLLTIASM